MTSITIYDGSSTIGGNKIYLEEKGRGIFLDFGMNFAKYGRFYQEFLSERSNRGIHDLLELDLIPKLNIYRTDLIPADVDTTRYPKLDVEAVLLSHAHLDHCGDLGLLNENIPIAASPISTAILKAMRDTSPSHLGSEISYHSPKTRIESLGGFVLESGRGGSYLSRDFYCSSPPGQELREFTSRRPGQDARNAKAVEPGELGEINDLHLPFEVESYPVDHSIYGANAYILKGDTTLAYTGDYRLHGRGADNTRRFIQAARNASVLITEGTRVGREADEEVTEADVHDNCLEAIQGEKGLVIADFSARNLERLEMFAELAEGTDRSLVVTAKDAYMLHAIGCAEGACVMDVGRIMVYGELKNRERIKWESEVVVGRWGDRYVSPAELSRSPERYILCFSFFDLKHLLDIKPSGGSYIYSSSEAFSEEQEIDFLRLYNWLRFFNLRISGFEVAEIDGEPRPIFTKGFHASGHLSQNDLINVVGEVDPDVLVPVHTERVDWFREAFPGIVSAPPDGRINL